MNRNNDQMPTINLAPEAVFPITKDENGKDLATPATGFKIPGTVQGEGKMAGIPTLFVRTAGCNLRCIWELPNGESCLCDTPMASFNMSGAKTFPIESVKKSVLQNLGNMNHLVVSGGEPFIQAKAVTTLIQQIRSERDIHVSIETNGTLFDSQLVQEIDFFSISPKLKNSIPTIAKTEKLGIEIPQNLERMETLRCNVEAIQLIIDHCRSVQKKDFQLKFVVRNRSELEEIESTFLSHLHNWNPEDIVLMPLGSTPEELFQTRMTAIEAAIERGWRFSPRLQINYFGGVAGV